jgi:photosystem II stability/assembly factor-like uncharacterized protein
MAVSNKAVAEKFGISTELVDLLRQTRGMTNSSLQELPERGLRRALRRLSYPDSARQRHEHLLKSARDDDGAIPANAVAQALRQVDAKLRRPRREGLVAGVPVDGHVQPLALVAPPPAAAGLAPKKWEWLGPGNVGGRTRAIVVHPKHPQQMLAASAGGGVWFTNDGGARWDPVDDFMANLAVSCLAINPVDPNEVFAGTGEGFGNGDALRGGGMFRILGTASWSALAATSSWPAINRIAVSADGKVVLAATPDGLMRSVDAARAVWKRVSAVPMADVKFHPANPLFAIAGGRGNGECFHSGDGGKTWTAATHAGAWSGRVELVYARKNPQVVYASVEGKAGELWRSANGGRSFTQCAVKTVDGHAAEFLGDQGWYGNVLWADDPTDEDFVLVGGVDLWKTTDAGATLHEISTWWDDRSIHADHHCIVSHPDYDGTHNRTVFFGNDGGIYAATDIRVPGSEPKAPFVNGWTALNNNYGVTQFYGAGIHPGTGRVVAGAQDNGCVALDPGAATRTWHAWFGGDGGWCAADPSDKNVFYGEYVYLNIHRNTDACATSDTNGDRYICGQFWNGTQGDWDWKPVPYLIPDARSQDALFIAPFVLDPHDSRRMLAGGLSLWQTTNAKQANTPTSGPRWTRIKASTGKAISAIAVSPADPDVVWVGHEDGAVFVSQDATSASPTWLRCPATGAGALAPARYCTSITPHDTDTKTAYAAFGGFVSDNLWVTQDGGHTWKALGTPLPAAPVRTLAIHPANGGFLYAGTEVGVFASEDAGATWTPTNQGPANVSVEYLFWSGKVLYAATHGRGMYRIDLA